MSRLPDVPVSYQEQLEDLIDRHGLHNVLQVIVGICGDKEIHLLDNWQDGTTAAQWRRAGNVVCTASNTPSVFRVS